MNEPVETTATTEQASKGFGKAVESFVIRYGSTAKFVAGIVLPGVPCIGPVLSQAFTSFIECVHETAKDQYVIPDDASSGWSDADEARLALVLDELVSGPMSMLCERIAALEARPDEAQEVFRLAKRTDRAIESVLAKLELLPLGLQGLEQ